MKLPLMTMRWLVVALAASLFLGCDLWDDDDDKDGSGGDDNGEVVLLPSYAYELTSMASDPITVVAPIGDSGDVTLTLTHIGDGPGMFGTYTVADELFTIAEGSTLVVNGTEQNPNLFRGFEIAITGTWIIPVDGPPMEGSMVVNRPFELVYVDVTADGLLQLRWDAIGDGTIDGEVVFSFEELDAVMDGDAPEWQKLGIAAIQIGGEFVSELMAYGIAGFELIVDELADVSPLTVTCDAFSDIPLAVPPPPPTIPDAGLMTFTWLDDSGDMQVGPGDSLDADWTYCLMITEPLEDEQIMLNGQYSLNSYTEVVVDGTLVRIGFEGTSPAGRPGGVLFDALEQWEVYPGESGTVAHRGALINGRMTLVFTEPAE